MQLAIELQVYRELLKETFSKNSAVGGKQN